MSHQRRPERRPDLDPPPRPESHARVCEWLGCAEDATFRAPRSRDDLRTYRWFCIDHVREYNRAWNFFAGMSREEIERHQREDVTWHRPTWDRTGKECGAEVHIHDPFGVFAEGGGNGHFSPPPRPQTEADRMLERLGLNAAADLADIKQRYKALVKANHPDLHGGDRAAEERLKLINEAYTYLLRCGEFA